MAVFFTVMGGSAKRSRVNERGIIPPLRVHVGNSLAASFAPKHWTMIEGKTVIFDRTTPKFYFIVRCFIHLNILLSYILVTLHFYLLYFDIQHAFSFVAILKQKKFLLRLEAKLWLSLLDRASLCIRVTFVFSIRESLKQFPCTVKDLVFLGASRKKVHETSPLASVRL